MGIDYKNHFQTPEFKTGDRVRTPLWAWAVLVTSLVSKTNPGKPAIFIKLDHGKQKKFLVEHIKPEINIIKIWDRVSYWDQSGKVIQVWLKNVQLDNNWPMPIVVQLDEDGSLINTMNTEVNILIEPIIHKWDKVIVNWWLTWTVIKEKWRHLISKSNGRNIVTVLLDKLWTTLVVLLENVTIDKKADQLDQEGIDQDIAAILKNARDRIELLWTPIDTNQSANI